MDGWTGSLQVRQWRKICQVHVYPFSFKYFPYDYHKAENILTEWTIHFRRFNTTDSFISQASCKESAMRTYQFRAVEPNTSPFACKIGHTVFPVGELTIVCVTFRRTIYQQKHIVMRPSNQRYDSTGESTVSEFKLRKWSWTGTSVCFM